MKRNSEFYVIYSTEGCGKFANQSGWFIEDISNAKAFTTKSEAKAFAKEKYLHYSTIERVSATYYMTQV